MKTQYEVWSRLKELEDILDEYLDPFGEAIKKVDGDIINHWCDRFERLRDKILTDWGIELCEEQKQIIKNSGLILGAALPDILNQK